MNTFEKSTLTKAKAFQYARSCQRDKTRPKQGEDNGRFPAAPAQVFSQFCPFYLLNYP